MKLLFKLVANTFGYGFVLKTSLPLCVWNLHISDERNMFVVENFIRSLVEKNGRYTVYTDDGGTWYPQACTFLHLKHRLHSHLEKSFIERVMQYFKDRTESFDDYYPCVNNKKRNCNL